MNYDKTIETLKTAYADCLKFWERENVENPKQEALNDIKRMATDPFSPHGEPLDQKAKSDFIKSAE